MCKGESANRSACVSLLVVFILVFTGTVHAFENIPYIFGQRNQDTELGDTKDPELMFAILARLGQSLMKANELENKNADAYDEYSIQRSNLANQIFFRPHSNDIENKKRGLDLGLSRGYSGSQQAKHMMGIAAAGLSGGPGRRRRSQEMYRHTDLPY